MPKYKHRKCCVGGCKNTAKDDVSWHFFPKNDKTREIWLRKVRITRGDDWSPNTCSVVCSVHFTDDMYTLSKHVLLTMAPEDRMQNTLIRDAIPTVFPDQGDVMRLITSPEPCPAPPSTHASPCPDTNTTSPYSDPSSTHASPRTDTDTMSPYPDPRPDPCTQKTSPWLPDCSDPCTYTTQVREAACISSHADHTPEVRMPGMDEAVPKIKKHPRKIEYAGAVHPLLQKIENAKEVKVDDNKTCKEWTADISHLLHKTAVDMEEKNQELEPSKQNAGRTAYATPETLVSNDFRKTHDPSAVPSSAIKTSEPLVSNTCTDTYTPLTVPWSDIKTEGERPHKRSRESILDGTEENVQPYPVLIFDKTKTMLQRGQEVVQSKEITDNPAVSAPQAPQSSTYTHNVPLMPISMIKKEKETLPEICTTENEVAKITNMTNSENTRIIKSPNITNSTHRESSNSKNVENTGQGMVSIIPSQSVSKLALSSEDNKRTPVVHVSDSSKGQLKLKKLASPSSVTPMYYVHIPHSVGMKHVMLIHEKPANHSVVPECGYLETCNTESTPVSSTVVCAPGSRDATNRRAITSQSTAHIAKLQSSHKNVTEADKRADSMHIEPQVTKGNNKLSTTSSQDSTCLDNHLVAKGKITNDESKLQGSMEIECYDVPDEQLNIHIAESKGERIVTVLPSGVRNKTGCKRKSTPLIAQREEVDEETVPNAATDQIQAEADGEIKEEVAANEAEDSEEWLSSSEETEKKTSDDDWMPSDPPSDDSRHGGKKKKVPTATLR